MSEIRYVDTRGRLAEPVSFTTALVEGLAPGGGLFVPERLPHLGLDEIVALGELPYAEAAARVFKAFETDLPDATVDELMARSYGSQFDAPGVIDVAESEKDTFVLELWHGPTAAFKDMALQCLPHFLTTSAQVRREAGELDEDFLILTATSGDTGSAALAGFADVPGVSIGVFYPKDGVSEVQRLQMTTMEGDNIAVWAREGNFDDCQRAVKDVFSDTAFALELKEEQKTALTSANSINWGRLLPQVVYYAVAYARLVGRGALEPGDVLDVSVPTGNFGNILAAYYARGMGVPLGRLVCASNENRVLADFISTGRYVTAGRAFKKTASPSMDILVSSNLERLLFDLSQREGGRVAGWMAELADAGAFDVGEKLLAELRETFVDEWVDDPACKREMRRVFEEADGYAIDPHTACAYLAARRNKGEAPMLVVSTAHWGKFSDTTLEALFGVDVRTLTDRLEALAADDAQAAAAHAAANPIELVNDFVALQTGRPLPRALTGLTGRPVRFDTCVPDDLADTEDLVRAFLRSQR